MIRCRAGNSGQCVATRDWGIEGSRSSCTDGSDKYRPITDFKPQPDIPPYMIPQSDPFKVPSVTMEDLEERKYDPFREHHGEEHEQWEWEWVQFYYSDYDYMIKDETTNRLMAATTDENCEGFVCKVKFILL